MIHPVTTHRPPPWRQRLVRLACVLCLSLFAASLPGSPFSQSGADRDTPTEAPAHSNQAHDAGQSAPPGYLQQAVAWVLTTQRALHQQLNRGIHALRADKSVTGVAWLIGISFLYGIFHAAGPGHGKAVISAYLLSHPAHLRTGLWLSLAASLMQALTAILLILGLVKLAGWLSRDALGQVATVELISFALVAGFGALLTLRAGRRLWRRAIAGTPAGPIDQSAQAYRQPLAPVADSTQRGSLSFRPIPPAPLASAASAQHGAAACDCGHGHHIHPGTVDTQGNRWAMAIAVAAVGLRPCTGAVLILAAANLLGLWTTGVLAVLAMALGTALTVCALATLAVYARGRATRLATALGSGSVTWLADVVAITGGLLILLAGAALFSAAAGSPPPVLHQL